MGLSALIGLGLGLCKFILFKHSRSESSSFTVSDMSTKVKVAQLCLTLRDPILQARILEWVAFPFSRGSSQLWDQTQVSCIAGEFFTSWATGEAQEYWSGSLSFFQQIFLSQKLNWGLLHWKWKRTRWYPDLWRYSPLAFGATAPALSHFQQVSWMQPSPTPSSRAGLRSWPLKSFSKETGRETRMQMGPGLLATGSPDC